jgi:hypothetical protein
MCASKRRRAPLRGSMNGISRAPGRSGPRAESVGAAGMVGSGCRVMPGFPTRCAPPFTDPKVGFIQAPQDYRG